MVYNLAEQYNRRTARKREKFGLTNTNKLIKQYQGCNGKKTGFTADGRILPFCISHRGDTHLIAVALGCETSEIRNAETSKLLDYGFTNYETCIIAEKRSGDGNH